MMMHDRQTGGQICIKIYKKSMVAVFVNMIVMISLIAMSHRSISLIREEEVILMNRNISQMACASFCSRQIDSEGQCCNGQQQCVQKQTCLQQTLREKDEQIKGYQFVITLCLVLLAISLLLTLIYLFIRCEERANRRRQLQQLQQRMLEYQEPQLDQYITLEWTEYILTNRNEEVCAICHDLMWMKRVGQLRCQHIFHAECIREWFESSPDVNTCPICRQIN